jgi:polar amino acid transport system substrate-binding protein
MQRRCAEFVFSEPLYRVELAWYVRTGDTLAEAGDHQALRDRRLCRPATYFTFDMLQEGLTASTATLVFPSTAEECLVLLEAGVVDAVSLARAAAEPEIARLGLEGKVSEIEALASAQTLHAIAHESNVEARAFLSALDRGLAEIRESGRWFELVARHLGPLGLSLR